MKKSKLARLIAAICCFAMLLTACNSNQTPAGSGGDVSTMADSEKKVLTYAIGAETTDLSTLYMNNSLCCTSKLVYENLVDFDNGEIVPGLARAGNIMMTRRSSPSICGRGLPSTMESRLTPRRSRLIWNTSSPTHLSIR